ncbi:MAG: hypothetical protein Q9165_006023 [Trypethelium subeluteriae]
MILGDGRKLGYSIYGVRKGYPIFWFHGWPGSRLEIKDSLQRYAAELNIRLISVDRPGIGLSDFQPNRTLLDWPKDVRTLAGQLGIQKYKVIGASGGGPYALACAKAIPASECSVVGVLSGVAPWNFENTQYMSHAMRIPRNITSWSYILGWLTVYRQVLHWKGYRRRALLISETKLQQGQCLGTKTSRTDLIRLESEVKVQELKKRDLEESTRQGIRGLVKDLRLQTSSWGFELEEIERNVLLWYGEEDKNTPIRAGCNMERRLPNGILKAYSGEDHFTVGKHIDEILKDLLNHERVFRNSSR